MSTTTTVAPAAADPEILAAILSGAEANLRDAFQMLNSALAASTVMLDHRQAPERVTVRVLADVMRERQAALLATWRTSTHLVQEHLLEPHPGS